MPPKRKRTTADLLSNHSELIGMPRKNILSLLKKIRGDNGAAIQTDHGVHMQSIDEDFNYRFNLVRTTHEFELGDGNKFTLEMADAGLLLQHVLSESPALAA